jgi:hypothetical protein
VDHTDSSSTQAIGMNRRTSMLSAMIEKRSFGWIPCVSNGATGFPRHEINHIHKIIEDNRQFLLERWNEYFNP